MPRAAPLTAVSIVLFACGPAGAGDEPVESAPRATSQPRPHEPAPATAAPLAGGDRQVGANYSRSPVYALHGVAATAHPLASQIAVDILKRGGSAVDAAIAANAALGLMEPTGNGIGGDLFAIVWDPSTRRLHGYNGSGRAPAGRSLAQLKTKLGDANEIPAYGSLPVTVPGTVDGWFDFSAPRGRLSLSRGRLLRGRSLAWRAKRIGTLVFGRTW